VEHRGGTGALRSPVIAILGDRDEYCTPAQLERIAEKARHAKVGTMLLADCGHAPHRDQPGSRAARRRTTRHRRTMSPVTLSRHGNVAVIAIDNPPVNALSHAVREGLQTRLAERSPIPA
jgi:hypothetical protein